VDDGKESHVVDISGLAPALPNLDAQLYICIVGVR